MIYVLLCVVEMLFVRYFCIRR